MDPKRLQSHVVPHWQPDRDGALKLVVAGGSPLRGQTRRREICDHTRWASFPLDLGGALFLKSYLLFASRLNGSCLLLGTLFTAAFAAPLARRGPVGILDAIKAPATLTDNNSPAQLQGVHVSKAGLQNTEFQFFVNKLKFNVLQIRYAHINLLRTAAVRASVGGR